MAFRAQVCWQAMSILDVAYCELLNAATFGAFLDSSKIQAVGCTKPDCMVCSADTLTALCPGLHPPLPLLGVLKIRVQYIKGLNFMDLK